MKHLTIDVENHIAIVKFENAPTGLMNKDASKELFDVLEQAESNDEIRALIFTGKEDGMFIRHYDVSEIAGVALSAHRGEFSDERFSGLPFMVLISKLKSFSKPTIAVINGMCTGGGFEFALACDFRIAASGAEPIGLPETNVGIMPTAGATHIVTALIGPAAAKRFIMCGSLGDADHVKDVGLIDEVSESPLEAAVALAKDLASRAPNAVQHVKAAVDRAAHGAFDDDWEYERKLFLDIFRKDDTSIKILEERLKQG